MKEEIFLKELERILTKNMTRERTSNPDFEALQYQFPALQFLPLSNDIIIIAADSANYQKEIKIPSGAQLMRVSTNNGVWVSRNQLKFPITTTTEIGGATAEFCPVNRDIWIRGVTTLNIGLLNQGDVATFSFYAHMNVTKLIEAD